MSLSLDFRNTNTLWCSVIAETLVRCGIKLAVCSPGSRSTPLTLAFAAHPGLEAVPIVDERSAAFFALGAAKASQTPVVLVCTSGTAGANYLPAIIEARETRVPLIVITADRPPEMRECASGQTIDQQKLFGTHVVWYHEYAVPMASMEMLAYARQMTAHACQRAVGVERGPVHLNAPFRDPLVPLPDKYVEAVHGQITADEFAHLSPVLPVRAASSATLRFPTSRGVIVAGTYATADDQAYVACVANLARRLGWPILADGLSPLRRIQPDGIEVITTYDLILRNEVLSRDLAPKAVLCLGRWPTSKVLRGWIQASQAEVVLVSPGSSNGDALHGRTRHVPLDPESLEVAEHAPQDRAYLGQWANAEKDARAYIDGTLDGVCPLHEPKAAWMLARGLSPATPVIVANSMPVRDVECVWPAVRNGPVIYCNRGANGIDGTLSTALGIAHHGLPAVLLTGDLAFLHDSNGLLIAPKFKGSLTVVLINNAGGGIFEHLPIAQYNPPFEEFFATPQEVEFSALAAAHQIPYSLVENWDTFDELIRTLPPKGIRIIELRTDRKRDAAFRKSLYGRRL